MRIFDYDNIMPPNRILKAVEYIRRLDAEFLFSNVKVADVSAHDMGRPLVNIEIIQYFEINKRKIC